MNRDEAHAFISALRGRCKADLGFAATLRRGAGRSIARSRMIGQWYGFFEPFREAQDIPPRAGDEVYFLCATLFALDRKAYKYSAPTPDATGDVSTSGSNDGARNFGASLAEAVRKDSAQDDPLARRLILLMDANFESDGEGSLPRHLRRLTTQLLAAGKRINWPTLLLDLDRWNSEDRKVQRAWARSFHRATMKGDDVFGTDNEATASANND